jgi:hypothetical protein
LTSKTALGVFLDIEGAFNNTCYDTMCDALVKHGSKYAIVWWIRATLEGRVAVMAPGGSPIRVAITRGCPQGGVLPPLLWCLVVDDVLARLSGSGIFIQGYADDMSSCGGKIPKHGIRTHAMGPFDRRDVVQRGRADG